MGSGILLALLVAQAPAARGFALDPAASSLRFHIAHPLHHVDGRARTLEAKAVLAPDGELKAMARAQVADLDTGDANRDANMREVLEPDRYPYVVVKATGHLVAPASLPAEVPLKLSAEVDLHGVKRTMEIPVKVRLEPGGAARVSGSFPVSLDAHKVERPSLLLRKVDDTCRIDLDLVLRPEGR